jgi:hypothetical protein
LAGTLSGTQPTSATGRHPKSLSFAADAVVTLHMVFVTFLAVGGLLPGGGRAALPMHVLALVVSAAIYLSGYDCPLTNVEKHLRTRAGEAVYPDGFIAHYLVRPFYADGMTAVLGLGLVGLVVGASLVAYGRALV